MTDGGFFDLVTEPGGVIQQVGLYMVAKKAPGALKIDARGSNFVFGPPPKVRLATEEFLQLVQSSADQMLHVASADISLFSQHEPPSSLARVLLAAADFGLPSGNQFSQWPRLEVLPLGWSHALTSICA